MFRQTVPLERPTLARHLWITGTQAGFSKGRVVAQWELRPLTSLSRFLAVLLLQMGPLCRIGSFVYAENTVDVPGGIVKYAQTLGSSLGDAEMDAVIAQCVIENVRVLFVFVFRPETPGIC